VELADRDPQPERRADLHHRVDGQRQQLAFAHAGAGQQLDDEAGEQVGLGAGGAQQLGGGRIVQEPRQGTVDDGQVGVEDQRPGRSVGVAPLGDAGEEAAQIDQGVLDAGLGQRRAGGPRVQGQVPLVGLDVGAAELGQRGDLGSMLGKPVAELA
jgi:hypothetical protein